MYVQIPELSLAEIQKRIFVSKTMSAIIFDKKIKFYSDNPPKTIILESNSTVKNNEKEG